MRRAAERADEQGGQGDRRAGGLRMRGRDRGLCLSVCQGHAKFEVELAAQGAQRA